MIVKRIVAAMRKNQDLEEEGRKVVFETGQKKIINKDLVRN